MVGSFLRFMAHLLLRAVLDSAAERKGCAWCLPSCPQADAGSKAYRSWWTTAVMQGALAGKTGGYFFSTATQGGGQETTALTGAPPATSSHD